MSGDRAAAPGGEPPLTNSIRAKMATIMFILCGGILVFVWLLTIGLFEPAYYRMIQKELGGVISAVERNLSDHETNNTLNEATLEKLEQSGICVEIAPKGQSMSVYYEGIGDGCALHYNEKTNFYGQAVLDKNSAQAVALRQRAVEEGSFETKIPNNTGGQQFVMGKYLPDHQVTILASTNLERVTQALAVFRKQLIIITYLVVLVSILASLMVSRWITRPITVLTKATRKMAEGDYNVSVPVQTDDELGILAQDFNDMAAEVNKSDKLQKELVANFSHDLRTPLTLIKGYAETIRDISGNNEKKRNAQLDVIIDETDRLSLLVGSALEYSKFQSGVVQVKKEAFDLNELLRDMALRYTLLYEQNHYQFTTDLCQDAQIVGDAALLERALNNLITNAAAHIGEDGMVLLSTENLPGEGVKVTVEDHGPGISKEDLPRLFDRYYRARSSEGRVGTGLGLSIVKAIFENQDCAYGVDSKPGEGARFWFIVKKE